MNETIVNKFFELIRITLGNQPTFEKLPSEQEWVQLFSIANMQSLSSLLLSGIEKVVSTPKDSLPSVFYEWIALRLNTETQNTLQNKRAKELTELLSKNQFQSCVLKGQGTAQYYEKPEIRPCGDIDMWVSKDGSSSDQVRDSIIQFAKRGCYQIGHIDIKHSDIEFFNDVPVEIHFLPSWMYNPRTDRLLQRFFTAQSGEQFDNYDDKLGFSHTTVDFDLVFSIVHIYRHIFSEGIGLRQLIDYYYILQRSTKTQRIEAIWVLDKLMMKPFVGGVMWILRDCFGMKEEYLLCPVNEKHGEFLLNEIMTSGNFGHYDNRRIERGNKGKFEYGVIQFRKNLRFLSYYPSEVLWSPLWKTWHFFWRKKKGYL
jgi:hypothetical protein